MAERARPTKSRVPTVSSLDCEQLVPASLKQQLRKSVSLTHQCGTDLAHERADSATIASASRPGREGPAISSASKSVVIVYRYPLVRDVLASIFAKEGISVAATIPEDDLSASSLENIDSDVIVCDEASEDIMQTVHEAIVYGPSPSGVTTVLAVGFGYLLTVVYAKQVLQDAGITELVVQARRALSSKAVSVVEEYSGT
jgi:hypothetical protein